MSHLFDPLNLRSVTLRNRLALSPMCQYEAQDGFVTPYHTVHYGKFALGGFALVMIEATAVSPEGRITHGDVGLWDDAQIEGLASIAAFIKKQGATPGIQIAHAGPKAGMQRPYNGDGPLTEEDHARGDHAWPIVSASALAVDENWPLPSALDANGITKVRKDFAAAAQRALKAGFEVLELHCTHGYLLNSFLSDGPLGTPANRDQPDRASAHAQSLGRRPKSSEPVAGKQLRGHRVAGSVKLSVTELRLTDTVLKRIAFKEKLIPPCVGPRNIENLVQLQP